MGAGQQGPEGPEGPKGADASPADVANILMTTKQNDLLNNLAKAVANLQGENSISSVAAKAFIDKVPDDFPVRVGNSLANNSKFTTNVAESMNKVTGENSVAALAATKFYSNLPSTFTDSVKQSMLSNVDFQTSLADKLSENPTMLTNVSGLLADSSKNATFVSTLTGDNKLIDNIANTLSNNDTYKNRLRGPPGTFGNETAIRTALSKYAILCNTAGSCQMPNESKAQLNISDDNTYQFTNSNKNGWGDIILGINNKSEKPQSTAGSLFIRNGNWATGIADGDKATQYNSGIANDTGVNKHLAIVGNASAGTGKREIGLWDNVAIANNLSVSGDKLTLGASTIYNGDAMDIIPKGNKLIVHGDLVMDTGKKLTVDGSTISNGDAMDITPKGNALYLHGKLVTDDYITSKGAIYAGNGNFGYIDGDNGGRVYAKNRVQIGDWIIYQSGNDLKFYNNGDKFIMKPNEAPVSVVGELVGQNKTYRFQNGVGGVLRHNGSQTWTDGASGNGQQESWKLVNAASQW